MSANSSTSSHPSQTRTISFGFLLVPLQALDMIGPMDLLNNINRPVVSHFAPDAEQCLSSFHSSKSHFFKVPTPALVASSPTIHFHHIGPTLDPVLSSGGCRMAPSTTIADCPKLDYLLIGGPAPIYFKDLPGDMKEFIVQRSKEVKAIFTTCTGGLVLAATGLLDGLPATSNHFCIPKYGEGWYPGVKWDSKKHWVVVKPGDGKEGERRANCEYWTAAGAGAGTDMIAEWIRQEFKAGEALLDYSTCLLEWRPSDVNGKPLAYFNGRGETVKA